MCFLGERRLPRRSLPPKPVQQHADTSKANHGANICRGVLAEPKQMRCTYRSPPLKSPNFGKLLSVTFTTPEIGLGVYVLDKSAEQDPGEAKLSV
jgi:hypothetical protein